MKRVAVEIVRIYEIEVEDDWTSDSKYAQDDIMESLPREWSKDDQLVYTIIGALDSDETAANRQEFVNARIRSAISTFSEDSQASFRKLLPGVFQHE